MTSNEPISPRALARSSAISPGPVRVGVIQRDLDAGAVELFTGEALLVDRGRRIGCTWSEFDFLSVELGKSRGFDRSRGRWR